MTPYERAQADAIAAWKAEEPSAASRAFDRLTAPIAWAVEKIVPDDLAHNVVLGVDGMARALVNAEDILARGDVTSITDLKSEDLSLSDALAEDVHNRALALAGGTGAALGATGVGGIALDLASLMTLALVTVRNIGVCYGYDEVEEAFVLGVLAASSANTRDEKKSALDHLRAVEAHLAGEAVESGLTDALLNRAARGGVFFTARGVFKRIAQNLARRKALQSVPMIGAVFGLATNAWFINDVAWAARRMFQERWMMDNDLGAAKPARKAKG
ncbi:MAG: EcsC family protein [Alphaproteobacteria bacterium]|nr:EcsC family protein [Alphaproteobacteria bacterium]MBF0249180.1 EcsC family protein [Alphaproteobacteria bacterium]